MSAATVEASATEDIPVVGDVSGANPSKEAKEVAVEQTVLERVREGGDFASDQIKIRDTKISELANQAKQYEVIAPYISVAGGPEQLLELATLGQKSQQIQSIPGLSELVQSSIQQGRIPTQDAPEDDRVEEWMDEDTKRVRDELTQRLDGLDQRFKELDSLAKSTSVRSQESHVQRNIDSIVSLFDRTPEGKEEALKMIEDNVDAAYRQAQAGNEGQRSMIDQLAGPKGGDVLKYMLMEAGLFEKYGAEIFGSGRTPNTAEDGQAVVVRMTDGRTSNPMRPDTPPLPAVPKGPVTTQTMRLLHDEIRRRRGRSPLA